MSVVLQLIAVIDKLNEENAILKAEIKEANMQHISDFGQNQMLYEERVNLREYVVVVEDWLKREEVLHENIKQKLLRMM